MSVLAERPERTVRAHCEVIGYDHQGRALYDAEACLMALSDLPQWRATRRPRRAAA